MFTFGIEHEVAFLNREGQFADFASTSFAEFEAIIAKLPTYAGDYPWLHVGDAGIRVKRWYIEGLERFDASGKLIDHLSKGIEIRTTPHPTIQGAIDELTQSFRILYETVVESGFSPVLTSFHPYRSEFVPDPPFNAFEEAQLQISPEDLTSPFSLLTYGPDINMSMQSMTTSAMIDIGHKFTYYSPYIIPFTYSSPFIEGHLWGGLSVRTFLRSGLRPATLVFLAHADELLDSVPSLTKLARIPGEVGRIEFKGCDSCDDFTIYAGICALLKGLALDTTLSGRALTPDVPLHQRSAFQGFSNTDISAGALAVLDAVRRALGADEDAQFLDPLYFMLQEGLTPAHRMIDTFQMTGSVGVALSKTYAGIACNL